jgi:hypothetical protein
MTELLEDDEDIACHITELFMLMDRQPINKAAAVPALLVANRTKDMTEEDREYFLGLIVRLVQKTWAEGM